MECDPFVLGNERRKCPFVVSCVPRNVFPYKIIPPFDILANALFVNLSEFEYVAIDIKHAMLLGNW